ncbi:hypothetical protein HGRIS_002938 [Hohenbuehelia grisea]|uniref:Uncharacterized protein n=1 Tax=Hohenbuehelia grisea TaxID=104357 RepID=A0ABR3JMT4_9AGAR
MNPYLVAGAAAAGGALIAPVAAPAVLGLVGFGAAGPVAGTMAAAMQASIGNVVLGSAFAGAQSVAMGGALPVVGTAIAAGISGTTAYVAKLFF